MAAPQVQSVEQIIQDLNPAYQDSIDIINRRREALPGQFESQRMGLYAQRGEEFNVINSQMAGRGLAGSGIGAHDMARYSSTHFLPGMQRLVEQENEAGFQLDEAMAGINQERRLRAMDTRASQQSSLEAYLAEQRQMQWEREQFNANMALERERLSQADRHHNSQLALSRSNAANSTVTPRAGFIQALNAAVNTEGQYKGVVSDTILGRLISQAGDYGLSTEEARAIAKTYSVRANDKY